VANLAGILACALPLTIPASDAPIHKTERVTKPPLDLSGLRRTGIASFYADSFAGKVMADGRRMNPRSTNAASRTLPLGTVARVTNLETHKSAVVMIQDRGPYVKGRIVDLSPSTARRIGITRKKGIAKVSVAPIALPPPHRPLTVALASSGPTREHQAR
jgi:rare lipoprotein A